MLVFDLINALFEFNGIFGRRITLAMAFNFAR
ncbi:hypothetical protein N473_14390 [Pseudoalteromonas luteoviolacea CPMOR-1]|uniref:Uncharacterized protein n=3 Tax=Pseudoalteromonas luteoviolacea TaxID=43657 RepID=A0A162C9M1_9GAMM|nr:hypothetical protein N479_01365 [Pseudoalteromonas luteoviolacea S4054]KZN50670.1 hypothetical protein N476_15385 [Pseudoalteromonas luteoviolacea H33]KZN64510.1 hypothetical protein N473_14390 [Pseudoalteromonas luteoviolacea CPMOR-1]KZN72332.1 hypothetical protein N481_15570 [Pseudoalteromonas luteoviolacea S4047-1]KZN77614.1 hypothetical protein N477_11630 [Pseudoalteromonas luteoviolacea H33-S]